jgi:hypothetical protein
MLRLTQEMKQFESIFLSEITPAGARARGEVWPVSHGFLDLNALREPAKD